MEEVDISSPEKREREDDFENQTESPAKKLKLSDSSDDKLSYHAELKEALRGLDSDSKNQILLQAIKFYPAVKKYRDKLIARVGELDKVFGDWVLRKAADIKEANNPK